MKILLVNPPRSPYNGILKHAPEEAKHFIHKKLIGPPLGLLTIAAGIKDYDLSFVDLKGQYDLDANTPALAVYIKSIIEKEKPDIIGVTFIASEFPYGIEIFEVAKSVNKQILTVAGGLHASLCPSDFDNKCVDVVCIGQAAGIFREVVIAKEKNTDFASIGGIYYRKNNVFIKSTAKQKPWFAASQNFLLPERRLLNPWLSTYKVGNSPFPATYLFTSLGCPYKCTFCSIWCQYDGAYYQRKVESVIEELKTLSDFPIVRFADANTVVDTVFINKLFDRIVEEGIKKEYVMDIRFDTVVNNPKLIEKIAKAGLKVVICGFESYRNEELIKYNKSTQASLLHKAIEILHDNNIMIRGNYVVPNHYTIDDFKALSEYASTHPVVYAGYTILSPMPGTPYYEEVKDEIIDHNLLKYNFFNSVLPTKMPLEEFYYNTAKLWLIKKGNDVI